MNQVRTDGHTFFQLYWWGTSRYMMYCRSKCGCCLPVFPITGKPWPKSRLFLGILTSSSQLNMLNGLSWTQLSCVEKNIVPYGYFTQLWKTVRLQVIYDDLLFEKQWFCIAIKIQILPNTWADIPLQKTRTGAIHFRGHIVIVNYIISCCNNILYYI